VKEARGPEARSQSKGGLASASGLWLLASGRFAVFREPRVKVFLGGIGTHRDCVAKVVAPA